MSATSEFKVRLNLAATNHRSLNTTLYRIPDDVRGGSSAVMIFIHFSSVFDKGLNSGPGGSSRNQGIQCLLLEFLRSRQH